MNNAASGSSGSGGTIVFAGGGSGGHIYPSIAIAERLTEANPGANLHFICASGPVDRRVLEPTGHAFTPINMTGLPRNPLRWPGFGLKLRRCQAVCRQLLRDANARCVVAMGGYVSGPAVFAARQLRIPTLLVNLDAKSGKANRRLAPHCDRVFSVYDTPGLGSTYEKVPFPVRRAALSSSPRSSKPGQPCLLVTGASLGAQTINDAMIELFKRGALKGWRVVHLTGERNDKQVRNLYGNADVQVIPFTDAMGERWGEADLAISRAGAGSVGEAVANRVPTIFLPYPYHADEHQRLNAQPYADSGACIVLRDTKDATTNADQLQPLLADLLAQPDRLIAMRRALEALNPADAAADGAGILAGVAAELAGFGENAR